MRNKIPKYRYPHAMRRDNAALFLSKSLADGVIGTCLIVRYAVCLLRVCGKSEIKELEYL